MKFLITIIIVLLSNASIAQHVTLSTPKTEYFYTGVDNPLSITAENCPCSLLVVKCDSGRITGKNCEYVFGSQNPGITNVTVYKKQNGKLKKLGKWFFRIKPIPDPVFSIGRQRGSGSIKSINKKEISIQQFVRADLDVDLGFEAHFTIISFNFAIVRNDGSTAKIITNKGAKLNDDIKSELQTIKEDDIITFNKIYVQGPDGIIRNIAPMVLEITE